PCTISNYVSIVRGGIPYIFSKCKYSGHIVARIKLNNLTTICSPIPSDYITNCNECSTTTRIRYFKCAGAINMNFSVITGYQTHNPPWGQVDNRINSEFCTRVNSNILSSGSTG